MPTKIQQDTFSDLEIDLFPTQDDSWLENVPKTQEKNGEKKSEITYFQAPIARCQGYEKNSRKIDKRERPIIKDDRKPKKKNRKKNKKRKSAKKSEAPRNFEIVENFGKSNKEGQKNDKNSMNIGEINSKLLEISEENKKLRIENENLKNEKDEKELEFDEVFKNMMRYSRKMMILENEKVEMSREIDHLRTINENLELTVEDFENQEKQFKKKMMQFIGQAPNVDRCAKRGSKRKALDESYMNKRRKQ